jgi:hypothetical protein
MADNSAVDNPSSITNPESNPPRVFFSYSRDDSAFVLDLANRLRIEGIDLWLDKFDIPMGMAWDNAVEQALKSCPTFLVVLSPSSVASTHVMDEVAYALGRHKVVIPVLARACEIPFRLSRLQYVDFTVDRERAIKKLLGVLRNLAETKAANNLERAAATCQATPALPDESIALNEVVGWRIRLIKGAALGFIASFFVVVLGASQGDGIGFIAILWSAAGAAIGVNSSSWRRVLWPVIGATMLFIVFAAPKFQLADLLMGLTFGFPIGAIVGAIIRYTLFF